MTKSASHSAWRVSAFRRLRERGALLAALLALPAGHAQVTTAHTFNLSPVDSEQISADLVQAEDGTIYGAARQGGANGAGTVFKIQPQGTGYQIIHSFAAGQNVVRLPEYSFILGRDGALYGTSEYGGTATYGSLYKIQRDGSGFTALHSFTSGGSAVVQGGGAPRGGLVHATDGFLYGLTTTGSGSSSSPGDRNGVIYRIATDGSDFSIIHSFNGGSGFANGKEPNRLIQGRDGNLYGSFREYGPGGGGGVFTIKTNGTGYAVIHAFPYRLGTQTVLPYEGVGPDSALLQAGDGYLYGTTRGGGRFGQGCVYRMLPDGLAFEVIYSFSTNKIANGSAPAGALIQGSDGALYGWTDSGGSFVNGNGVVFKLRTDGSGFRPIASLPFGFRKFPTLIQISDGSFIGAGPESMVGIVEIPGPEIMRHPRGQTVAAGGSVTFSVTSTGATDYQWRRNGVDIPGAISADYTLANLTTAANGTYSVIVSIGVAFFGGEAVTSSNAELRVLAPNPGRLVNLSVRSTAGSGSQTLIAGMVVGGTGSKKVLVRGVGPTLATFGVAGVLADPKLSLFPGGSATPLFTNSGWGGTQVLATAFEQAGAFELGAATLDSALLSNLPAGAYSAQVTSVAGATGVALVEAYDADGPAAPAGFVNLSARTVTGTGDQTLIAGFVLTGNVPRTLLIRGVGPSLEDFGVTGVLAYPRLELHTKVNNNDTIVASNAGWAGVPALSLAFDEVGAFQLPVKSGDAALLVSVAPGSYTAQITGAGATTGVALVEIYEVP